MTDILTRLLAATKVRDVTEWLVGVEAQRLPRIGWRNVGDNENNLATINLGSDPAAGLIERVTNAFDAVLELEWVRRGEPAHLLSPRSAVEEWFGITGGRLSQIGDFREAAVAPLIGRIEVTLQESDRADRPTLDIRDYGIGIASADFGTSILSLHRSRKLRKLFLAGAFGQGGSTALAYSPLTIIVSRPAGASNHSVSRPVQRAALTVVRFNPGDPRTDKHGVYEYLIDHATGHPIEVEVPGDMFTAGTLVRHVSMELGKYRGLLTAPSNSLWFLVHNYLFDPVLPVRLFENRPNSVQGERRSAAGNHRLLTRGEHTEYQREAQLTFRSGTVGIKWWVLSGIGDNAKDRITQYVQPSKPIIVTYNGQKQGDFSNTVIKNDLRLPYLERYLIVHVDCDKLDNEARRQLFPTTREALRDTAIGEDLKRLIIDTLSGDPELSRLDEERKRRYLQRADTTAIENIRRRLGNRVRAVMQAAGGGRAPRALPPDGPRTSEPQPPIPVQEPPTFLEVSSPDPRKVYAGRRFTVHFKTDADPAYFLNPDSFIAIIDAPSFGQYTGTTNVRDGYGVAHFNASEDLDLGSQARITLEVRPRRAQSLHASLTAEVAAPPAAAATGEGQVATPNVNPMWVNEGDAFWVDNNWSRRSVAKVVRGVESVEIYVSAANERLVALISRAQRRGLEAVDTIKDFYLEHVAFHAFLESADQAPTATEQEDEASATRAEENKELMRACETVCGITEALFDVLVTHVEAASPQTQPDTPAPATATAD